MARWLKQAMVSGIKGIMWSVVMAGLTALCIIYIRKSWKIANESDLFVDAENAKFTTLVLGFFAVVTLIWSLCAIDFALTALLNPEYWAIKEVLDAVKD